ncbi:MAG: ribonuclease III [Clostridia bacterium]|nr:ribonuclease III [Clostridia bacterium]
MDEARLRQLAELERRCQVELSDRRLLNTALTHATYTFENRHLGWEHNQRLEFLGDAVLGMLLAEYLYRTYPDKAEGELTRMRAAVACEATLARKARELDLGSFLLLGRGEGMAGGQNRPSILADAFEALVAAIFLDAGLEEARKFVWGRFAPEFEQLPYVDYKSELQELIQQHYEENVSYRVLGESGPDHDKRFTVGVFFRGKLLATGYGKSKKEAEQKAAAAALEKLEQEFPFAPSNINNLD